MICSNCKCHKKKPTGPCSVCGTVDLPEVVKPKYSIPKKSEKQKKVTADDIRFYQRIWATREHYSQVSGEPLGAELECTFFAHLLPKGAYPEFRHLEFNVLLMTFDEHYEFDHGTPEGPKWDKVFALADKLKELYYKKNKDENQNRTSPLLPLSGE